MSPSLAEAIAAIKEGAKEDRFTYLTILECNVTSPETLPVLNDVLQGDTQLTQEIGWDLVQLLLGVPGSETCLETVARLGNPREVIIKVMEALAIMAATANDDDGDEGERERERDENENQGEGDGKVTSSPDLPARFVVLLGMLSILHRRIRTKYPSRFLGSSLAKVLEAYQPNPAMTAAVINLVRSLSGRKRPALPTRKSSLNVTNLDQDEKASARNAPDPEAEPEDPTEEKMQEKLLQSFTTCVLERYVNQTSMQWAPRLLETYEPERRIPGRKTITAAFSDDDGLHERDAVVGQLVALLLDLGVDRCSSSFIHSICECEAGFNPAATYEDFSSADEIRLSPGGALCLIAYWIFSTDVFEADNPTPHMHLFPEHLTLLERFLGIGSQADMKAQSEIQSRPGVTEALLTIGLGLEHRSWITAGDEPDTMTYHHALTLIAVFHPDVQVRAAATRFAGLMLHSDPDPQNRINILEDLLENCVFASLKACAVSWLKEELMATRRGADPENPFSTSSVIDKLQYFILPDMLQVKGMDGIQLAQFWAENGAFLLQAANFAYFLFSGPEELIPPGMAMAVEQRFAEPLIAAAEMLLSQQDMGEHDKMELEVLVDRLKRLPYDG